MACGIDLAPILSQAAIVIHKSEGRCDIEMESRGVCRACNRTISGRGMTRHLQSCPERKKAQSEQGSGKVFLIKASAGPFWVYFEVNDSSTLVDIDIFLRDLWLECCGHMSAFTIDSVEYFSTTEFLEPGEKDMNRQLRKVIRPGVKFRHEYDFGTTTELDLKCISERSGKVREKVEILARNEMPEFYCDECERLAEEICGECDEFLCESCAKKHGCGEDMFLPVVNSPRMGMCGYSG